MHQNPAVGHGLTGGNRFRKLGLPVAILATAALLAGCEASVSTGGNTLDSDDAAKTITGQYPTKADGLKLTSLECGDADAKVDETFDCTGKNDAGVELEITGTINQVDEDTGKVGFTWDVTKATSDGVAFANTATDTLKAQGYAVDSMTCPDIVIEKGNEVECDLTMANGSKQTVTLTLTDGDGGFNVNTSGPLDNS